MMANVCDIPEYGTNEYYDFVDETSKSERDEYWNYLLEIVNNFNNSNMEDTGFLVLKNGEPSLSMIYLFNGTLLEMDPMYKILRDVFENGIDSQYRIYGISGNIGKVYEFDDLYGVVDFVNLFGKVNIESEEDKIENILNFIEKSILPKEDENEIQRDLEAVPSLLNMDPRMDFKPYKSRSIFDKEIDMEMFRTLGYGGIFISPKIRKDIKKFNWYSEYLGENPSVIIWYLDQLLLEETKIINIIGYESNPEYLNITN